MKDNNLAGNKISFLDVVLKKNKYFHPFGGKAKGWPVDPPNYIGFRYDGKLQSVHHIEKWQIVNGLDTVFKEVEPFSHDHKHLVYDLGPAIKPSQTIKTGKLYPSGRVWAMLDLLLTSKTISEARDKTKERLAED